MRKLALALLALTAAWLAPARADALVCGILGCSCTVTMTDIDFGDFSPLDGPQDAEGEVEVDCTGLLELNPTMAVKMQSGTWGTIPARRMRSGDGHYLDYNIYTTSQATTVWGNGTIGPSVTLSGSLLGIGHWRVTRTVNARVTPTVTTRPGDYEDDVIVRIDW